MVASEQSVGEFNRKQFDLYVSLIDEEFNDELKEAIADDDRVEMLDALLDIMVVTIGALHSLGVEPAEAWNEVVRSNMSKVDPETGKVIKREDGKVLKPATYSPPELAQFVK
jgi:predicted HAD superfamily Cof-like phosphohydrolase